MKKRLIGSLLMGTLLVSSTSVFVSCKDYDDDINKNSSSIAAMQTQLSTLETALKEAQADAAAAKAAAEAANSSLDQKIADLLAQLENADEETKAVILQQIEDLKSNYATKAELAAAQQKVSELEAVINQMKEQLNNTVSRDEMTLAIEKAIQDQIAAIDPSLLVGEWKTEVDARLNTYEGALAICQKQIENQRQVLNTLIEALLGNDAATARIRAALDAIDEDGNIDEETLEALKKRMQTISDVVDEIAPEGNVISLFVDRQLKSLVFIPQTYYWGVEAAKITRLTPKPYLKYSASNAWTMKELTSYIDNDAAREEVVGTKGWNLANKELSVNYTDTNKDREATHDRYAQGSEITVMLDAEAKYHVNPTTAKFEDDTKVSIISANKSFTRAAATVSVLGNADKATGMWTVANGELTVPLNVIGTLGKVVDKADGTPDNTNSTITTFAVQVQYGDTTVTSDYATLVEEIVKDLRLTHKPFTNARNTRSDLIQTGLLNDHCGQCELYKLGTVEQGMHLFATVGEVKDFVISSKTGQDLVGYQEDINLSNLIETHYTTSNSQHAKFEGENFTRNFEYKFELTDFRYAAGNNTNESAHAAIYQKNGAYFLHPQDPQAGGFNGRPYQGENDKATEVVVDRVPLVRVSLVYKPTGDIVDYGYLPIRITKEAEQARPQEYVYVGYDAFDLLGNEANKTINRYNDCYFEGGSNVEVIKTDWRKTEEDLLSHEVFQTTLGRALTVQEFEQHYTAQHTLSGTLNDLDQYYLTNEASYLANPQTVKPEFALVASTPYRISKIGNIAYENISTGGGLTTAILSWNMVATEVEAVANTTGWDRVVRAIYLKSDDTVTYPDMYIVFTSGQFTIANKVVEANMKVKDHRINEYWYTAGNAPFQQGDAEIHTNVITPEENTWGTHGSPYMTWKPIDFENTIRYVFENNFNSGNFVTWMDITGKSSTSGQPFTNNNVTLGLFFDDSANGTYYGYTQPGAASAFTVKNTTIGDLSKKNLYATLGGVTEKIATIDGSWNGTVADITGLRNIKIKLLDSDFAKALLNYKDHAEIGEPGVLKATVAVLPLVKGTDVPQVLTENGKSYVAQAVKYTHDGTTDWCKLYISNYNFDVRFLRPVSINNFEPKVIEDATSTTNAPQIIKLSELVSGYTDFRGSWKTISSMDYEEYYAPLGTNKFTVSVQSLTPGAYLSDNREVLTNLNQADEDTFVPLYTVSSDIIFQMISADEIEYRNAGSTVQKFQIKIPVQVEYIWGTIYDNVTVTIKKTQNNSRQK